MKRIIVVIIIFLSCATVFAQQYNFSTFTIEQGLSQSQIFALYEDKGGYLWVGTDGGGVCRFDGTTFIEYNTELGLSNNQIRAIYQDHTGNIWFGTKDGYVSKYDGKNFTNYNNKNGLESNTIICITEDKNGTMWFGSVNSGLYKLNKNQFEKVNLKKYASITTVNCLYVSKNKELYVGSENKGLFKLENNQFVNYTTTEGLAGNTVNAIAEDANGNIWIATNTGASKFDGITFINLTTSNGLMCNDISSVIMDKSNNIWFGSYGKGVCRYNGKSFNYFNQTNGLPNNFITCMLRDNGGNIWLGSDGAGISKFDGERFKHISNEDGLTSMVMSIFEDKNKTIWFGTRGSGVCKFVDNKLSYLSTKDGMNSNVIYSINQDKNGNYWFGSKDQGISVWDGKRMKCFTTNDGLVSNKTYSIINDNNGYVWIGTYGGGINIYDGNKFTSLTKNEGLTSNSIYTLFKDKKGNIWIGTDNTGVDMIPADINAADLIKNNKLLENQVFNISKKDGLSNDQVMAITEDKAGNIWFGTFGGGICKFDGKQVSAFSMKTGLNSNNVYFLICDSQNMLWVGTEKGICRVDINSKFVMPIRIYSKVEGYRGIESNLNAVLEDSKGFIWFGTVKGVTQYNRNEDLPNKLQPLTHIEKVSLFFKDADWNIYSDSISRKTKLPVNLVLPYNQNHLSFQFVGIDLKAPEKVTYQWILDGFDNMWSPITTKREMTYSNIPHGHYTFKVRACNSDGVWDKEPVSFSFTIKPPFYFTWWFYFIVLGVVGSIVAGTIKIRERQHKHTRIMLEDEVQSRTLLLLEEKAKVEQQSEELRSQAESLEEMNHQLEKLSLVARETDNSIMIADKDGNIEWVNEAFTKVFGYSLEEFKEVRGDNIYETSSFPDIKNAITKASETRESIVYVSQTKAKDDSLLWIQTTLTPILDEYDMLKQLVAVDSDITKIKVAEQIIQREKDKSDSILNNILPMSTTEELKEKGYATPRSYKKATVLFTDVKGFTKISEKLTPQELIMELNTHFVKFDEIIEKFYIEKIKTIGDAYMCAGGLPIRNKSHPVDCVLAGLEIQRYMNDENEWKAGHDLPVWELRCGIHTGEVVAGVVGKKKFAYDIWGDTVNIASRMESAGEVGRVNISGDTYKMIKDYFVCEYRGKIEAKNKGKIDMYFVHGINPELSIDGKGFKPNEKFRQIMAEL